MNIKFIKFTQLLLINLKFSLFIFLINNIILCIILIYTHYIEFMSWTDEKVAKLKELWGKGNTASQIAEIIGGISRNAVIGRIMPL